MSVMLPSSPDAAAIEAWELLHQKYGKQTFLEEEAGEALFSFSDA